MVLIGPFLNKSEASKRLANEKPSKDVLKDQKNLNYIVVCSGRLSNSLSDWLSNPNPQSDWLSNQYRYIFFSEGVENGLFNGDDILNEYKRKVRRLYNHVTETSTMNIEIETLVMLTAGKSKNRALRTIRISDLVTKNSFLYP